MPACRGRPHEPSRQGRLLKSCTWRARRFAVSRSALAATGTLVWALCQSPSAFVCSTQARRELIARIAVAPALLLVEQAAAFGNAIPEVERFAANRNAGPQPQDLGLKVRKLNKFDVSEGPVLKECGTGPNCFSTTADPDDDIITTLLPRWRIPADQPKASAMAQLVQLVRDYPPGQNKVDGGGFQIVTVKDDYLYAQFESLKKGRVDDVEFHMDTDGSVEVRSAGRIGQKADFGSNAKRLNYLSAKLREVGWTATEITKDTHPYYFAKNAGKEKVQSVGIKSKTNFELIDEEPGPRL